MKTNEIKIRKSWGSLVPVERIHGKGKQGHKPKFNKRDRHDWKKNVD